MLTTSNVHERDYPVPPARAGALLDTLAGPDDRVWPRHWPRIRFDRPLGPGATGGHGPIRYSVARYEPGRLVECAFDPKIGFIGTHTLEIRPGVTENSCTVRHVLIARPTATGRLMWVAGIRWLHDALLEELLDRIGTELGHPPAHPARRSPWVRLLRLVLSVNRRTYSPSTSDRSVHGLGAGTPV